MALAALTFYFVVQPTDRAEGQSELPRVFLESVVPAESTSNGKAKEGERIIVTLRLTKPNTEDKCSGGGASLVCLEGGIIVFDSFNDHEEDGAAADELIAFRFFGDETTEVLTIP